MTTAPIGTAIDQPPTPSAAYDVVVCGAGAAGLTLAIDLARRGVDFVLVDRAHGPFHGSRGKGVQPRSQEVLEDLGVLDAVVASGGEYPVQRYYTDEGPVDRAAVELSDATDAEPYQIPLLVPQFLHEARLRERLAELGHAPHYEHRLVGFEQDDDGVRVTLDTPDGERDVGASYLIGTDGGGSTVRGAAGIEFTGHTLGVRAIVADVYADGATREVWHRWGQGTPEQISLCPLYGTDMFQLQGPVPFDVDVDLSAEGLTALFQERSGRDDVQVTAVSWASAFEMNERLAAAYRVGRVLIAGDAAHCHPPTGGQGLNTSLQDAYNLGWKLAAVLEGAHDELLDTYETERRPIAEAVLGLSAHLLELARSRPTSRGREVSQLDLGYPDSPLSLDASPRAGGLVSGERAPDASLTGAAGAPTRLFTKLAGPHWTLLGYAVDRSGAPAPRRGLHVHTVGAGGDLVDDRGHLRSAYRLEDGDWVLIRPDGYVAAIVTDPQQALAHLDRFALCPPVSFVAP